MTTGSVKSGMTTKSAPFIAVLTQIYFSVGMVPLSKHHPGPLGHPHNWQNFPTVV